MKRKILVALLAATLTTGAFAGCGNKSEGEGRVQAAVADAESGQNENDGNPEGEASKAESEAVVDSTAEPAATAQPTAEPASESAAAPTAKPASDGGAVSDVNMNNVNIETESGDQAADATQPDTAGYTFDESVAGVMFAKSSVNLRSLPSTDGNKVGRLSGGQEVKVTGQCVETGWYRIQLDDESIVYASDSYIVAEKPQTQTANQGGSKTQTGGQTTQGGAGTQTAQTETTGTSAQTSTEAELCNSEFIALLNADRAAMGLSQISVTSTLDSDALESAKAMTTNFSHDAIVRTHGVNRANIASGQSSVSSVYDGWKNSPGHWAAMTDANLQYCSVARCGNFWVFVGYASNPVVENLTNGTTTVEQEVENGNLGIVNTDEGTGVSVYGTPGDTHVATEEENKQAADWGWDF